MDGRRTLPSHPPRDRELARRLAEVLRDRGGVEPGSLRAELRLAELGLDSVGLLELLLECERVSGGRLPAELLERGPVTFGDLLRSLGGSTDGGSAP